MKKSKAVTELESLLATARELRNTAQLALHLVLNGKPDAEEKVKLFSGGKRAAGGKCTYTLSAYGVHRACGGVLVMRFHSDLNKRDSIDAFPLESELSNMMASTRTEETAALACAADRLQVKVRKIQAVRNA